MNLALCYHLLTNGENIVFRPAKYASFFLVVVLSLCTLGHAQGSDENVHIIPRKSADQPASKVVDDPTLKTHTKPLKVDVDLVLVNVTVTDPMNRLVTGLEKENFRLLEANAQQDIRHFSSEDAPISVGVILDLSGSMNNKMLKARDAIVEFFKTANPQDEFFLVTFADKPELLADFTQSIEEIQGRLVYSVPKGRTALLDAVYLGVSKMRDAKHNKKALLVISDGADNRSRYTDSEIKSLVKEADVQIYAIGIFDDVRGTPEEVRGPYMLSEMTDVTGGRTFPVSDINDLADVAVKIGVELRNQYVLGYRPTNKTRDGKWRKLKVKLNAPKGLPPLNVHTKTGYYAPQQ
ncbi:MAG TPA: VWA domain-containing protein [Terriglobales bacterium]|nr:VWA domain-containing protein [Terriglobales bacterium]